MSKTLTATPSWPRPARQSGFTLLEIMVVVVIIGILVTIVATRVMDKPDTARVVKAKTDIRTMESALNLYRLDNFVYPSTEQGLDALVHQPAGEPTAKNWKPGGYIDHMPKDPWGNAYQYLNPGAHGEIDIFTLGADGNPGGDGINADIGNWNIE